MSRAWIFLFCASVLWGADRITLLCDEHAAAPLAGGWGYSALVDYRGKRILFDAGGNAAALEKNAKTLGIDLARLDAVVISHDDPDHYIGLDAVYPVNPGVRVYVPESESGAFSTSLMTHVWRHLEGLLPGQHVVDPPSLANYIRISTSGTEILPGARLVQLPFDSGKRHEQALLLDVPGGVAILAGCAHPGIVNFVKASGAHVRLASGGFHLMTASDSEMKRTVNELKQAGVESVAPAHCTGRFAIVELRRVFGAKCEIVAVGGSIPLPR
jgi:7,8-dihydropterin-6-yl-methyl-4-(beta-D-ribofuranosyl)aminobenzene 5'-phosphate synthase